jgi:hypothetical protein
MLAARTAEQLAATVEIMNGTLESACYSCSRLRGTTYHWL